MNQLKKNGFTMIEALLSLMVSLLISSMACMIFSVVFHLLSVTSNNQNQYAILQLRQLCAIADCQVENQELKLSLNQENYVVHFDRNRLVKESGYEILMEGIDDAYFEEQKGSIYLVYAYKTEKYHFEIA